MSKKQTTVVTAQEKVAEGVKPELTAIEQEILNFAKMLESLTREEKKTKTITYKRVDLLRHSEPYIVVPEGMSFKKLREYIDSFEKDHEAYVDIHMEFDAFPLDGARALYKAIQGIYGFAQSVPTPGFFGDSPPTMVSMQVGPDETENVIWGEFSVPNLEGRLATNIGGDRNGIPKFVLSGTVKKKEEAKVKQIGEMMKLILRSHSAYRGKAVKLDLSWIRDRRQFNVTVNMPKFMDLAGRDEPLILSKKSEDGLMTTLFYRIMYPERVLASGNSLKTGILLAGEPGTGKSLTARKIAQLCEKHNVAFIYVSDARDFAKAIEFAYLYEPAIVFVEDIDKVLEDRTLTMNEILNTMDSIDKGRSVSVVLTTNHIERIDPVAIRPGGRIDLIVELGEVDLYAAEKFLRLYGQNAAGESLLDPKADFSEIHNLMVNMRPAFISTSVANAKTVAEIRGSLITPEIMEQQLGAMEYHQDLLDRISGKKKEQKDLLAMVMNEATNKLTGELVRVVSSATLDNTDGEWRLKVDNQRLTFNQE